MSKNLNTSIGFGEIQYERTLIDVLYSYAVLGGYLKFYKN